MANAELPCVVVNMMRGQGDYFQATRGGGHGDYRHIVLSPATVQEAVDLVGLAFHLADRWRNPVDVLGDFLVGHTSEAVAFRPRAERDLPPKDWAATGARGRRAHNVTPLGSPEMVLVVQGSNFVPGSVVLWNGANRPTTFIGTNQLRATIPASDLALMVPVSVTVFTPGPGGGTSLPQMFNITP